MPDQLENHYLMHTLISYELKLHRNSWEIAIYVLLLQCEPLQEFYSLKVKTLPISYKSKKIIFFLEMENVKFVSSYVVK